MCMNTSPNVLERLKLLRFIGIDIFTTKQLCIMVSRSDNSKIQNALFWKRKTSPNWKLAPPMNTNSEDFANLILEI